MGLAMPNPIASPFRLRRSLVGLALGFLVLGATSSFRQVEEAGDEITHMRIEGPLDVGTQALLRRAIDHARGHAELLLIEIDTPGGEIELMWHMANAILDASDDGVRTVAWVNDRAISAGSLLAMVCDELYMRSHATIGSATPVTIGPTGMAPVSEDPDIKEKSYSYLRGEFRGMASRKGRSPLLAEAMVDLKVEVLLVNYDGERRLVSPSEWSDLQRTGKPLSRIRTVVDNQTLLNLSGSEAVELMLADGLRESLDEVLGKMGRARHEVVTLMPTGSEKMAGFLYMIGPLLLIAGLILAYLELKAPGFGIAGILAVACFAMMLFGRYLVGLADIPDLLLMGVGVTLLAVEIFVVPGTVWVGLLGGVCIIGGMIWSFAAAGSGFQYDLDQRLLLDQTTSVALTALFALVAVWGLSRVLPKTPLYNRLAVGPTEGDTAFAAAMPEASDAHSLAARVGARGRALTALRPVGKVVLDAAPHLEFEARSEGPQIDAGAGVRVVECQPSGRLLVETTSAADPTDPSLS